MSLCISMTPSTAPSTVALGGAADSRLVMYSMTYPKTCKRVDSLSRSRRHTVKDCHDSVTVEISLFKHDEASAESDVPDGVTIALVVPLNLIPTVVGRAADPDDVENADTEEPEVMGGEAMACLTNTGARSWGIMDAWMQVKTVHRWHSTVKESTCILECGVNILAEIDRDVYRTNKRADAKYNK